MTLHRPTRARGGGDGDDGWEPGGDGTGPVVAHVFEVPQGQGLRHHEGHGLGRVQPAAAAKGQHTIVPGGLEYFDAGIHLRAGGVRAHGGEHAAMQARRLANAHDALGHFVLAEALVGDQQGARKAQLAAEVWQFIRAPGAKTDGGGVIPVGSKSHAQLLIMYVYVCRC
jgi:hypothetical protein